MELDVETGGSVLEKLKVGVVGLRRGLAHVKSALRLENVDLVAVADRREMFRTRAQGVIEEHGASTVVLSEYDELLAVKPDAIVVATNGKLQVEHSCIALDAGCHVLSEVPGMYTLDEAIRLRDTVERTGRTYMLAENMCYEHFLPYWRKWIVEDRFGPISLAEAEYIHYLPETLWTADGTRFKPTEAAGKSGVSPIWRADQPPIQYLMHDLGPLLELMDDRVVSATCRSGPWWQREAPLRSDGQFALFETEKGSVIRILVTLNCRRPSEHRKRLFGTEGGLEHFSYEGFTRRFDRNRSEREGWEIVRIDRTPHGLDIASGHGGTDIKTVKAFVDAVLAGRAAPIDVYRAIDYSLPGILADESARRGGAPVPVPNLHRGPFPGTRFWESIPLPEDEPQGETYVRDAVGR